MKSLADLARDWAQARQALQRSTDDIPRIAGIIAVKIIKANFIAESYDSGIGVTKWPKRKDSTNRSYDRGKTLNVKTGKLSKYRTGKNGVFKGSVYSSANPLLRQTLALFNSINYVASKRSVFVGVNSAIVPYARFHNEGISPQPSRQYMPKPNQKPNIKMLRAIQTRILRERKDALKNFLK